MQLTFELPDVDKKATKKAVEKAFEEYNMYKPMRSTMFDGSPSGSLVAAYPRNDADTIHGQNRDRSAAVTYNNYIDRTLMIQQVEKVVDSLPPQEKMIIQCTMMKPEDCRLSDSMMMDEIKLGKTKY